jgi:hypothetical protein
MKTDGYANGSTMAVALSTMSPSSAGRVQSEAISARDEQHDPAPGPSRPNDPLAGLTKKQVWSDCIWISDETTETKLFLLCVGRYFDAEGRNSSMSYTQIAHDCSLSERACKYAAKRARDSWLRIEVGKGFKTASGPQNLYHAVVAERWVAELRRRRGQGLPVAIDEALTEKLKGVQEVHPTVGEGVQDEHLSGVQAVHLADEGVHQTTARGAPGASRLTITPKTKEDKREVHAVHPSCGLNKRWTSAEAQMAAAIDASEAQAQAQVCINEFGGIDVSAEFRQWLLANGSTPEGMRDGLKRAASKCDSKSKAVHVRGKVIEYCSYAENDQKKLAVKPKSASRVL